MPDRDEKMKECLFPLCAMRIFSFRQTALKQKNPLMCCETGQSNISQIPGFIRSR